MHAIIAGANKAGTTSLFRYLSDHPQVAPSQKKETDFFLSDHCQDVADVGARYEALFDRRNASLVRLEASPAYLRGGRAVAERIARTLPDAHLLFLLREPVSRLVSYLRVNAQHRYKEEVATLDDETYVALVERIASGPEPSGPGPLRNAFLQFERGCYARYLQQFFDCFDDDEVLILFFDDLRRDARTLTQHVCTFLGMDPAFYDSYAFGIENRTRAHRFGTLQRAMSRLNARLEPWLNRYPVARKALRRGYGLINEQPAARGDERGLDERLARRLELLYRPHNEALRLLLTQRYPQLSLPGWVRGGVGP